MSLHGIESAYMEICPVCCGFGDRRTMVPVEGDGYWDGRCYLGARGLSAVLSLPTLVLLALPVNEMATAARAIESELRSRAKRVQLAA